MLNNRELRSVLDFLKVEPDNGYLQRLVLEWIDYHEPFCDVTDVSAEFHRIVGDELSLV